MRIVSLTLACLLAAAFTPGCTYDKYVPETSYIMGNKLQVFEAAKKIVKQYAYLIRENPIRGEIDAAMPMDYRFAAPTRNRIFVKVYKVADEYYDPDVRVICDIDVSEPDPFVARPVMQQWRTVFFPKALEVKIRNEILAELGMDFKKGGKKMLKAEQYESPPETEPQKVAEAPEEIKATRKALNTKLKAIAFEGITLEAAAKELAKLTGLNIVLTGEAKRMASDIGSKIELNLTGVKAGDVLDLMLDNAGKPFFSHINRNGVIMIDVLEGFLRTSRRQRM